MWLKLSFVFLCLGLLVFRPIAFCEEKGEIILNQTIEKEEKKQEVIKQTEPEKETKQTTKKEDENYGTKIRVLYIILFISFIYLLLTYRRKRI